MKLTITPTYKQSLAWAAWENGLVDDVVFGGGAGSGKSRWLTEAISLSALKYPETRYFLARKELDALMKTTYITLTQIVLPAWGLPNNRLIKTPGGDGVPAWTYNSNRNVLRFYNGSEINFLHLDQQPRDPLFDRFGSHEYTQGGIDEASEVEFRAYDVLRSRVGRWKNDVYGLKGKMGMTLNPSQDWPYRLFYDPWKKADRPSDPNKPLVSMKGILDGQEVNRTFVFIQALVGDNPHIEHQYKVNLATISDPVLRMRLQQGDWEFSSAIDILFDAATIADVFTNKVVRSTDRYMTVDVSRSRDLFVIRYWQGWHSYRTEIHDPKKEGLITAPRAADWIRTGLTTEGIPRAHVLVDQDGVGGGVVDLVPGVIGFSGAAAPFGTIGEQQTREQYENLRAQCVYHTAEVARNRQLAVTETNTTARELLAADMQQFKRRDAEKDGKLKVSKKEDMKQALGRSPDCGDTLWMRAYFDLRIREEALQQGGEMHVFIPE